MGASAIDLELKQLRTGPVKGGGADGSGAHCPFVIHVIDEIVKIGKEYENNISFIAISSNDVEIYPDDSPELMVLAL